MSEIYFKSRDQEIRLLGARKERSRFHSLGSAPGMRILSIQNDPAYLRGVRALVGSGYPSHELKNGLDLDWAGFQKLKQELELFLFGHSSNESLLNGRIRTSQIADNTALLVGNDAIKLGARIHSQCEIHAFVEPQNHQWISNVIQQGVESGLYLSQSWLPVIEFLRSGLVDPVVLSYSVCDGFPEDGKDWDSAIATLREDGKKSKLELCPEDWDGYYFDQGWDALKLGELLSMCADYIDKGGQNPESFLKEVCDDYLQRQVHSYQAWRETKLRFSRWDA